MPTPQNTCAYIALGSNLPSREGSPAQTLAAAVHELGACGKVRAQSSIYKTEPVGFDDQPFFLNSVVALETTLDPDALLEKLLVIEKQFGRNRQENPRNGPRTLDLDLLIFGTMILTQPHLTVPHPALAKRRFVLAPLAEIAPTLQHPELHQTIAELLAVLPDEDENAADAVVRLGPILEEARTA